MCRLLKARAHDTAPELTESKLSSTNWYNFTGAHHQNLN